MASHARRIVLALGGSIALIAALGAAGTVFAGAGCHPADAIPDDASDRTVRIKGCAFGPEILHVTPGTTVVWVNGDRGPHAVTGNGWGTAQQLETGEISEHRFTTPGIHPYQCYLHPGMVGAVVVGQSTVGAGPAVGQGAPATADDAAGTAAADVAGGAAVTTASIAPATAVLVAPALLGLVAGYAFGRRRRQHVDDVARGPGSDV